jgi:hypothetical protein
MNVVVGGDSNDILLCTSGSGPVPIIAYYTDLGVLWWSKQIVSTKYNF